MNILFTFLCKKITHISWSFQFQATENELWLIEAEEEFIGGSAEGQRGQEKGQHQSVGGTGVTRTLLPTWRGPDAAA